MLFFSLLSVFIKQHKDNQERYKMQINKRGNSSICHTPGC